MSVFVNVFVSEFVSVFVGVGVVVVVVVVKQGAGKKTIDIPVLLSISERPSSLTGLENIPRSTQQF